MFQRLRKYHSLFSSSGLNILPKSKPEKVDFKHIVLKITQEPPTYSTFRKFDLNLNSTTLLLSKLNEIDMEARSKILFTTNLLSYARKLWGKSLIKAKEANLVEAIQLMNKEFVPEALPSLIQNASYSFEPENHIMPLVSLLVHYQNRLDNHQFSNSLYGIAKMARKNVQQYSEPSNAAAIQRVVLYSSSTNALTQLTPFIMLRTWRDIKQLIELLIAYNKLEICDHDNIGQFILGQINELLQTQTKYSRELTQLLHTLSIYDAQPSEKEMIYDMAVKLRRLFEKDIQSENITSLSVSLVALNKLNQIDKDLIVRGIDRFCELQNFANIQDLSAILSVSFKFEIMTPGLSKATTMIFDALKNNAEINFLSKIIPNMGNMINQRLLEKKFINDFLITVKIMHEKRKINQLFFNEFSEETKKIENQDIRQKFQQINQLIKH